MWFPNDIWKFNIENTTLLAKLSRTKKITENIPGFPIEIADIKSGWYSVCNGFVISHSNEIQILFLSAYSCIISFSSINILSSQLLSNFLVYLLDWNENKINKFFTYGFVYLLKIKFLQLFKQIEFFPLLNYFMLVLSKQIYNIQVL